MLTTLQDMIAEHSMWDEQESIGVYVDLLFSCIFVLSAYYSSLGHIGLDCHTLHTLQASQ